MTLTWLASFFSVSQICCYVISREYQIAWCREIPLLPRNASARLEILRQAIDFFAAWKTSGAPQSVCVYRTENGFCFFCIDGELLENTMDKPLAAVAGPFLINGAEIKNRSDQKSWPYAKLRSLNRDQLANIASMLCGKNVGIDIPSPDALSSAYVPFASAQLESLDAFQIERNNFLEIKMLGLIANGQSDELERLFSDNMTFHVPLHMKDYGLRTAKDLMISGNSLACRAAIHGGLPPVYARCLCAHYLDQIEAAETLPQLLTLRKQALFTYCKKLQEYKRQNYSPVVSRAIGYIQTDLCNSPSLEQISRDLNISPEHLSRKIRAETGKTFTDLLTSFRLDEACSYLTHTLLPVLEIASMTGFGSSSSFCRLFKLKTGLTPLQWRNRHKTEKPGGFADRAPE